MVIDRSIEVSEIREDIEKSEEEEMEASLSSAEISLSPQKIDVRGEEHPELLVGKELFL